MQEKKGGSSLLLFCFCLSLACFASGLQLDLQSNLELSLKQGVPEQGMAVRVPRNKKIQGLESQPKSTREEASPLCDENDRFFVQENAFDSSVNHFHWSSYNTDRAWAITEENDLHMSKDAGRTWEIILEGVTQIFEGANGDVLYTKVAQGMQVTTDFIHWKSVESDYPVYFFEVHPTEPTWAAAIFLEGSCSESHKSSHCTYNLRWTKDGGESWGVIGSNVYSLTWAGAGRNGVREDSLIFLRSDFILSRTTSLDMAKPEWENLMEKCYYLTYINEVVVGVHLGDNSKAEVFESRDDGESFTYPRLPENVRKVVYLLNGPSGVSYLQVPEDGNLYESSVDGSIYSLLIKHVEFADDILKAGFHSMQSLIGNFVANVVLVDEEEYTLRTMISHEMGSEWFPLPVPKGMSCSEGEICSLNLYGEESGYSIFSQQQAAGIIVANGHVGDKLIVPPKVLRTEVFLSRDSGQSFEKIADGPHYFGLGDHGGMLVMLDSEQTEELKYSPNQGIDIERCTFSPKGEIVFDALYSEPANKGLRFIAVGSREMDDGSEAGVIVHFDFSNYFNRTCKASDYESYTPKNMEGEPCLLGQKHAFIRRRRDSSCLSSVDFEPEANSTLCDCERDDYLCGYCYEEVDGLLCERTYENDCAEYDPSVVPEGCEGTYEIPTGYVKVPRDKCEGRGLDPWDQSPEVRPCNDTHHYKDDDDQKDDDDEHGGENFFFLFYIFVAGAVVVIVCFSVPPIRNFFGSLFRSITSSGETDDELFGEKYKTVEAANAVSLLDSDEEVGGDKGDDDAFLFGGEGDGGDQQKEDDLFGDFGDGDKGEEEDSAGML